MDVENPLPQSVHSEEKLIFVYPEILVHMRKLRSPKGKEVCHWRIMDFLLCFMHIINAYLKDKFNRLRVISSNIRCRCYFFTHFQCCSKVSCDKISSNKKWSLCHAMLSEDHIVRYSNIILWHYLDATIFYIFNVPVK